jgi:hypothetical protein
MSLKAILINEIRITFLTSLLKINVETWIFKMNINIHNVVLMYS